MGHHPLGYEVVDGYLQVNEEPMKGHAMSEASVIRLVYSLMSDYGFSTVAIADYLNNIKVPPSYAKDARKVSSDGKRKKATAGVWRPGRIRNMLVNTIYMGLHTFGKRSKKKRELITRDVPAIVSPEVWCRAQKQLRDNQIESCQVAKYQYLLRGLIKYKLCGLNYIGTTPHKSRNGMKGWYRCNGKRDRHRGPHVEKCESKNISVEWLENIVWNDIVGFITNPGEVSRALSEALDEKMSKTAEIEAERIVVMQALADKETEKQSILDLYRRNLIDSTDIALQLQKIKVETLELQERVRELNTLLEQENDLVRQVDSAEELLLQLRQTVDRALAFEDKREIVKLLVESITVDTKVDDAGNKFAEVRINYIFDGGSTHGRACGHPRLISIGDSRLCLIENGAKSFKLTGLLRRF
ncbi:MAG: recombinase family protein [Actinobacteria bacterium]|nr:recombinase family protein [Actinomycetota bacterium]